MTAIHVATSATSAQAVHLGRELASSATATADPSSLLPIPQSAASAEGLSLLYMFESKDRAGDLERGKSDLASNTRSRADARKDLDKAIQAANDAAKDRGFWDDLGASLGKIAKVAAVVASVAAAVATAGAATPVAALAIVGACMSVAGFAQGELHVLEKLGVDPETAGWIGTGLSLGGAATSGGAAFCAAGTEGGSAVAEGVSRGATVVAGASTVAAGASKIESSHFKKEQDDSLADAALHEFAIHKQQQRMNFLLDNLRDSDQESGRMLDHIGKTISARNEAATSVAVHWRG